MKRSWIETFSESLGLIRKISDRPDWSEENKIEGPKEMEIGDFKYRNGVLTLRIKTSEAL